MVLLTVLFGIVDDSVLLIGIDPLMMMTNDDVDDCCGIIVVLLLVMTQCVVLLLTFWLTQCIELTQYFYWYWYCHYWPIVIGEVILCCGIYHYRYWRPDVTKTDGDCDWPDDPSIVGVLVLTSIDQWPSGNYEASYWLLFGIDYWRYSDPESSDDPLLFYYYYYCYRYWYWYWLILFWPSIDDWQYCYCYWWRLRDEYLPWY